MFKVKFKSNKLLFPRLKAGITKKQREAMFRMPPNVKNTELELLGLQHVAAPFILLTIGLFLATITFFIEIYCNKR